MSVDMKVRSKSAVHDFADFIEGIRSSGNQDKFLGRVDLTNGTFEFAELADFHCAKDGVTLILFADANKVGQPVGTFIPRERIESMSVITKQNI